MSNNTVAIYIYTFMVSVAIAGLITTIHMEKKTTPEPVRQVQKFRFLEPCPDGLRVEYVDTIRLPKSVVCQKSVGE